MTVFFWVVEMFFHKSILRTPSTLTRMPSWAAATRVKGPPEPKSRVTDQRTEKLSFGSVTPAGSP
ncbi:hypothetical protein GCM10010272_30810 [Streptomyces lateritius]|nr:hypothetical protein GCM10010272_30810 [Streptomyces lateritius]